MKCAKDAVAIIARAIRGAVARFGSMGILRDGLVIRVRILSGAS